MPTFFAHWIASNRAPVVRNRLTQMLKGSSKAVIRRASSGVSMRFSSASVRVQTIAATTPPAEVPEMTRGIRPASKNPFTTPK